MNFMNADFLEIIKTRRSCRKYRPDQITDEELQAVLEAGTYAPTSRGLQAPFIVAVQNEEQRAELAAMRWACECCAWSMLWELDEVRHERTHAR